MNELELEVARSGEREYISSATGPAPGHELVSGQVGPPNKPEEWPKHSSRCRVGTA
jgi:hypothetical protein